MQIKIYCSNLKIVQKKVNKSGLIGLTILKSAGGSVHFLLQRQAQRANAKC